MCIRDRKILIADDELRMRSVIADYLRIKGYAVLEAEDGEQTLEIFRRERPHLVLLDVMMPKKDGWEVCRELRAESDVPIIMLTARGEAEDELHGFSLGVDEYIAKPVSYTHLDVYKRQVNSIPSAFAASARTTSCCTCALVLAMK